MTGKRPKDENREAGPIDADEILPEYDFSRAGPNKYAARFAGDGIAVVLDPDVAEMFPSAGKVDEALRALGRIIRKHRPGKTLSRSGGLLAGGNARSMDYGRISPWRNQKSDEQVYGAAALAGQSPEPHRKPS